MGIPHSSQSAKVSHNGEAYADSLVNHLFSVGLRLYTAPEQNASHGPAWRSQAIEELDLAIRDMQLMALTRAGSTDHLSVQ